MALGWLFKMRVQKHVDEALDEKMHDIKAEIGLQVDDAIMREARKVTGEVTETGFHLVGIAEMWRLWPNATRETVCREWHGGLEMSDLRFGAKGYDWSAEAARELAGIFVTESAS